MRSIFREFRELSQPKNVTLISTTHGINEFFSIAIPPIIPFLVSDLDITFAQAGLLLTVFFVIYSVFQMPVGMLSDRVGKKRLLVGGMIGMAGGIFFASTAGNYAMLIAAQILAGIGGSTFHPTGMSLISDFETRETEGKAMGIFGFGGMIGTASAPLLIGGVAGVFDWRNALAVAAIFGLVVTIFFVVFFVEPDDDRTASEPTRSTDADDPVQHDGGQTGFVQRIRRGVLNVLHVRFTWGVTLLLALTMLVSMQTRAIMTFTTSYVFTSTGQTVSVANVVFFVMLFAGSLSTLAAGSLADRFDRGKLGVGASVLTTMFIGVIFVVIESIGSLSEILLLGSLFVAFFAIGVSMYGALPVKNAMISQYAEQEFSGSLFGMTQTTGALGSATGPALFGYLATEYGMAIAYPLIAVVSVLVAVVYLLLSRDAKRNLPSE